MFGLSVFILVWVRLFFMMQGHRTLIEPTPPVWQQSLAKAAHVALYGLMIVLPLLGWLMLSAKGKTIPFLA